MSARVLAVGRCVFGGCGFRGRCNVRLLWGRGPSGFSPPNLKYMVKFAWEWPDRKLAQRSVALIPRRSNLTFLEKLKEPDLRLWYAEKIA